MISFDDYGGSGGDVDLSPIYASLGALKSNTLMIWDFVSTISNTTISYSTPYLESYRSDKENYMYNITGYVPSSVNGFQIINGVPLLNSLTLLGTDDIFQHNISFAPYVLDCKYSRFDFINISGMMGLNVTFTSGDKLKLDLYNNSHFEIENVDYITLIGDKLSVNISSIPNNITNAKKLYVSMNEINYLYVSTATNCNFNINNASNLYYFNVNNLSINGNNIYTYYANNINNLFINNSILNIAYCQNVEMINITANSVNQITFTNDKCFNIDCLKLKGKANTSLNNFVSCSNGNIKCDEMSYNGFALITNCNCNFNIADSITFENMTKLTMNGISGGNISFSNANFIECCCDSLHHFTAKNIKEMKNNIMSCTNFLMANNKLNGLVNSLYYGTINDCTLNLSGQSLSNNILTSISGTLNYSFMKECTFESCNNLSINLIGMSDVSFKDCKNLTVNYFDNYKNTFNNCTAVSVKLEYVHTSISFTNINSLTYNAVLISTNQANSTPLKQDSQWINRLVIRNLPFIGSSYWMALSMLNKFGVLYSNVTGLGQLEENFEDTHYIVG